MTKYRHELSAILSATALIGGPLAVLGDVLERRVASGAGLTPAEVRAAVRLVAAARADAATQAPTLAPPAATCATAMPRAVRKHPAPANRA